MELVEVDNIKQYLKDGILKGTIRPFYVVRNVTVTARRGTVGEIINSFSPEGNYSTTKTVFRTTNGEVDWVLTNEDGDSFVMDDEGFKTNYSETDKPNIYESNDSEKLVMQINEPISFRNHHGNTYRVLAGHYVMAVDGNDFHELTPMALESHYKILKKPYDFEKDATFFSE